MLGITLEFEFDAEFVKDKDEDLYVEVTDSEGKNVLQIMKDLGFTVQHWSSRDEIFSGSGIAVINTSNPKILHLPKAADRIGHGVYQIDMVSVGGPVITIWVNPLVDKLLK